MVVIENEACKTVIIENDFGDIKQFSLLLDEQPNNLQKDKINQAFKQRQIKEHIRYLTKKYNRPLTKAEIRDAKKGVI